MAKYKKIKILCIIMSRKLKNCLSQLVKINRSRVKINKSRGKNIGCKCQTITPWGKIGTAFPEKIYNKDRCLRLISHIFINIK